MMTRKRKKRQNARIPYRTLGVARSPTATGESIFKGGSVALCPACDEAANDS